MRYLQHIERKEKHKINAQNGPLLIESSVPQYRRPYRNSLMLDTLRGSGGRIALVKLINIYYINK